MGRKSLRKNKTSFQLAREGAHMTRRKASEKLEFISESRLEKIESRLTKADPAEVLKMEEVYQAYGLTARFCKEECPIGKACQPEIEEKELPMLVLDITYAADSLQKKKAMMIDLGRKKNLNSEDLESLKETMEDLNLLVKAAGELKIWLQKKEKEQETKK